MKRDDINPDDLLDQTARDIREESIDPALVERAAARVWARLSQTESVRAEGAFPREVSMTPAQDAGSTASGTAHPTRPDAIRGCPGFQALLPVYLAGALPQARALLVEDHLRECTICRRALDDRRHGRVGSASPATSLPVRGRSSGMRWGLAAAATLAAVLVGLGAWQKLGTSTAGEARLQSVQGTIYRVSGSTPLPMIENATFSYGQEVRTAKGSRAVILLADGSRVEMNDRSEMSVRRSGRDTTIDLPRGDIIVQAAKRTSGHLYVQSGDARVAVTGTIFAVSHGTKGSRVSVIEGEVHVAHGAEEDVLHPGDQVSTHRSIGKVPLAQEIAWSGDVDRYLALLNEMASLRHELEQVKSPGLRYSTTLLDAMPAGTIVYGAIPNLSGTLIEANKRIQDHIAQSEVLRSWFDRKAGIQTGDRTLQQVLDKIRVLGNQLGDEIVLSVQADTKGDIGGIVMMAELTNPASFRPFLEEEIRKASLVSESGSESSHDPKLRILPDDLREAQITGDHDILLWIHDGKLVAGTTLDLIRQVGANIDSPRSNAFATTSFRQRIAESYRDGAGWLFCADIETLLSHMAAHEQSAVPGVHIHVMKQTGFEDARQLILEVKESGDRTNARAVLSFDKTPSGMASWLAPPASMGALTFMSPDATLLAAFVVKEPVLLMDDLFRMIEAANPQFRDEIAKFESENGVSLRDDVAAPLGGELALALDGPVLPVPAWKVVFEVYDPVRLQQTIERVVSKLDEVSRREGHGDISLESETSGERTFYTVRSSAFELHYVVVDGYLVAAPRRALLDRAIQCHESGYGVTGSEAFRSLLPQDGRANFSAVLYQNVGPLLGPVAQGLSQGSALTPDQQKAVAALGAGTPATLAYAYSEGKTITLASTGKGTIASSLGGLFGLEGGEQGIAQIFRQAIEQEGGHHEASR